MGRIGVDLYPQQIGVGLREVDELRQVPGWQRRPTSRWPQRATGGAPPSSPGPARTRSGSTCTTPCGASAWTTATSPASPACPRRSPSARSSRRTTSRCTSTGEPKAPDLEIRAEDLDEEALRAAGVLWVTVTGLSQQPSRDATLHALRVRGRRGPTVLDLDYRPMFWSSREEARRWVQEALPHATVAVGNLDECDTAVDERDPRPGRCGAARARRRPGGGQAGTGGRARRDRAASRWSCPPVPVEVVNGLGAGDAFGGALCHGLLSDWGLERSMRFCNAAGAIVAARLSCSDAMPTLRRSRPSSRRPSMRDDDIADLVRTRTGTPAGRRRGGRRPTAPRRAARRARPAHDDRGRPPRPRGAAAGADPTRHGRPRELLDRLCVALERPGVNGVLGTADVLDDLLLLGALEGKVVVGSMNRGGLAGSVVRARRPVHRPGRVVDRRRRLRGRQDAHAHRPRRPRDRADGAGERRRRQRPGAARPDGDGRAVHVVARRRRGAQRAHGGRHGQGGRDRAGLGTHVGLHLAQAAGGRRDGAGVRREHAAGPASWAARSAPTRTPTFAAWEKVLALPTRAGAGDRAVAAVPARRRRGRRRRTSRWACCDPGTPRAGPAGLRPAPPPPAPSPSR